MLSWQLLSCCPAASRAAERQAGICGWAQPQQQLIRDPAPWSVVSGQDSCLHCLQDLIPRRDLAPKVVVPTAAEAFRQQVQVAAKQLALQYQQVSIGGRSSDTR